MDSLVRLNTEILVALNYWLFTVPAEWKVRRVRLEANLHFSGVRYWYDKGLTAGKTWTEEAEQRILDPRCSGVVFYLSENLFLSPSILQEIKMVKDVKPFFTINLRTKQPFIF